MPNQNRGSKLKTKEAIDAILKHAAGVRQGIGHIRNGANVTSEELWSANESLDLLFKAAIQARDSLTEHKPKITTGHCKHKNQPGGCQLHNLQCGYPRCDQKAE